MRLWRDVAGGALAASLTLAAWSCGDATSGEPGDPSSPATSATANGAAGGAGAGATGGGGGTGGAGGSIVGPCTHDVCTHGDYLEFGCDPCVDAICAADDICCSIAWDEYCTAAVAQYPDVCACRAESVCVGLIDEDLDGLYDCQDPDCAAACTPGETPIGDPCTSASDCDHPAPACLDEPTLGWSDGYCSGFCSLGAGDCGAGAICAVHAIGDVELGLCHALCDPASPGACRPGYACTEVEGDFVCKPIPEECTNGADDELDGKIDCADPECAFEFTCFEDCENGFDDDDNGAVDCDDPDCNGFPPCAEWTCAGFATDIAASCIAVGGAVACHPITNEGCGDGQACDAHYGNYAFECVDGPHDQGVCAGCGDGALCEMGSTCVATAPDLSDAQCAKFCCADSDCGAGSACDKLVVSSIIGLGSPVGACVEFATLE